MTPEPEVQPSEDIVRKIQKLLSLATGGNNSQEEAASAMSMAQRMLARYNLDYYTVQAAQVEEKRERVQADYGAMYKFQRDLWACISEVNFCWHWVSKVSGKNRRGYHVYANRHMLLGRESNVLSVKLMGAYLCDTLERILPYPNQERLSRSALSWRAGAAERLVERLRDQYAESQKRPDAVAAGSTALTLFDVAQREKAANYDARWGVGAWQKKLAASAEWEAGAADRADEAREWLEYLQKETPEQKQQRERLEEKERIRDARRSERQHRTWDNENRRESRKTDWSAREAGRRTADSISLCRQVEPGTRQKALVS
jgi:hypothetical protein